MKTDPAALAVFLFFFILITVMGLAALPLALTLDRIANGVTREEIREVFSAYADGTDVVWAQEEPYNSGAWYFMNARLPAILEGRFPLRCVSRVESASPATGSMGAHEIEQAQLIDEAFSPTKSGRTSTRPRASA